MHLCNLVADCNETHASVAPASSSLACNAPRKACSKFSASSSFLLCERRTFVGQLGACGLAVVMLCMMPTWALRTRFRHLLCSCDCFRVGKARAAATVFPRIDRLGLSVLVLPERAHMLFESPLFESLLFEKEKRRNVGQERWARWSRSRKSLCSGFAAQFQ